MKIQIILLNDQGIFPGEHLEVSFEQYRSIVEMSKNFYETGFEMTDEEGGFVIFPPEIVKKSVLRIKILDQEDV